MKVYILTADTYYGGWGREISLIGVYDSLEKAENAKGISIFPLSEINEVDLNEDTNVYLGGYIE